MLKKKAVVFGLIGTIVAGFGFAGCAGAQSSVGDVETTEVVDTVATAANGGESGATGNGAKPAEGTDNGSDSGNAGNGDAGDIDVKEADGKYIYTILDGRVEVPCETRIEDYLIYGSKKYPDKYHFDIYSLAEKYGWETDEVTSRIDMGPDATDIGWHWAGASGNIIGKAGQPIIDGIFIGFKTGNLCCYPQSAVTAEKAEYLTYNAINSLTFDQIVLMTYGIEQETKNPYENPFEKLLTGVVVMDSNRQFFIDQIL